MISCVRSLDCRELGAQGSTRCHLRAEIVYGITPKDEEDISERVKKKFYE